MGGMVQGGLALDLAGAVSGLADRLAATLETHPGGPTTWRPCRLLFRNFWLFQREEFRFVHGRLFLRGANTSGKSTVLAAALPLLLDGSRTRHRLDTFGGTGRTMQYFLVGPDTADKSDPDAFYFEQRTGYLALEFERPDAPGAGSGGPRHLTIGMGLHCSRHHDARPVTFWGFLVRDGRRLGHDLDVVGSDGVALRRQDLEALLGDGGRVVSTVAEYRALVDDALFGFGDPEAYANLLQLLLELRAPKLNRDMGPQVVADLLGQALPPIDRGLFDQMQSILQRIDDYVDHCTMLRRHHDAVARVDEAVIQVQARRAEGTAARYLDAAQGLRQAQAQLAAALDQKQAMAAALDQARRRASALDERCEVIAGELGALRESEVMKAEVALGGARQRAEAAAQQVRATADHVHELEVRLRAAESALRLAGQQRQGHGEALAAAATAYLEAAVAAEWPLGREAAERAASALAPLWEGTASADGGSAALQLPWLVDAARERRERLRQVRGCLDACTAASQALAEAEARFGVAHQHTREARDRQVQAERARAEAGEDAAEALLGWHASLAALRIPAEVAQAAAGALRDHADPQVQPVALLGAVHAAIAQERAAGEARRLRCSQTREAAATALKAKEAELREAERRTEAVPPRAAAAAAARAALAAAGIRAQAFYEAYDLDPNLPAASASRIEAAAEQAGLLDALVLPPAEIARAQQVLAEAHLADTWVLEPDTAATSLGAASGFGPEGLWHQGWLAGQAAPSEPDAGARYFGTENRRRRHQRQLEELRAAAAQLAEALITAERELAAAVAEGRQADLESGTLDTLPALGQLGQAAALETSATAAVTRAEAAEDAVAADVRAARVRRDACDGALEAAQAQVPESRGRNRQGLDGLLEALAALVAAGQGAEAAARALALAQERVTACHDHQAAARGDHAAAVAAAERAQLARQREAAALATLERVLESPSGRADRERYRALLSEESALQRERIELAENLGGVQAHLEAATVSVEARRGEQGALAAEEAGAQAALEHQLGAYPSLAAALEALRSGPSGPGDVARALLGRRTADAQQRRRIEADERAAERTLGQTEFECREILADYGPEYNSERALVRFVAAGPSQWPAQLRQDLEGRLLAQEQLLQTSERELYEDFILGQMRDSIHGRIRDAEDWLERINQDLREAPLGSGEILQLRWTPLPPQSGAPGAGLAAHVGLLRTHPGLLPPTERDALAGAFRAEVERVRRLDRQESADLGFAEALEDALDYRRWFRFEIVSRAPHQRPVVIDERRFSTRSGAEKSLALMLPLVAAAAARYDAARVDAPRLVAFDEAFAGVDPQNVGEALRFLCRFGFCWIMASERLWGLGPALPAAATYELVRHGNVVGALPFLWDGSAAQLRDVTAEAAAASAGVRPAE